jgi:hypothetical protein
MPYILRELWQETLCVSSSFNGLGVGEEEKEKEVEKEEVNSLTT